MLKPFAPRGMREDEGAPPMRADQLQTKYGGFAPRYTSYPTAPHFSENVGPALYADWLGALTDEHAVSLYAHVPYCRRLCWYCGCTTRATQSYAPIRTYAQTLLAEIALIRSALRAAPIARRLHWGGGTPTALSGADFLSVMQALRGAFDFARDAEIAIEIDPGTVSETMIDILAEVGVTRASVGVQSLAEKVQQAVNRVQSFERVARVIGALRAAGVGAVNIDLMYGLPHQTVTDVEETTRVCLDLGPDRVSVFGYAHVPWMKSHQRLIDEAALPCPAERLKQAAAAAQTLTDAGYVAIGLDHFALPDDPLARRAADGGLRRNFQGYTDDDADALIGVGASAISSLPQGYAQNHAATRDYQRSVEAGRLPIARGIAVNDDDRLRRAVIERLMCDYRADLRGLAMAHDADPAGFADELARLRAFEEDGLVTIDGEVVTVAPEARAYVRSVCAVFDKYLSTGKGRHSLAV